MQTEPLCNLLKVKFFYNYLFLNAFEMAGLLFVCRGSLQSMLGFLNNCVLNVHEIFSFVSLPFQLSLFFCL